MITELAKGVLATKFDWVFEQEATVRLPSVIGVVSSYMTPLEKQRYRWVRDNPELFFGKRGDYVAMGLWVREVFDEVLIADGMFPRQQAYLRGLKAKPGS